MHINSVLSFQDGASCKVWISKAITNLLFAHAIPDCMNIQIKYVCKFCSLYYLIDIHLYKTNLAGISYLHSSKLFTAS